MPRHIAHQLAILSRAMLAENERDAETAARHARRDGRRAAEVHQAVAAVERQGVEGRS